MLELWLGQRENECLISPKRKIQESGVEFNIIPFSLAYALSYACSLHALRQEWQRARERAEAVMTLSTEQEFPFWFAWGTMVYGWALAEQGQEREGINQMRQGRAPFIFTPLAEAYGKVGQVEEGLAVLAKVLALVDKTGIRAGEAELYRLKGQLMLQLQPQVSGSRFHAPNIQSPTLSAQAEAEEYLLKAIEIARTQHAKSWELRAVMSLARLWRSQGKKAAAHRTLSEIYHWFTEGFDTADLKEAKALLEALDL